MERDRDAEREARKVALESMDRRLLELPELRAEIVKVRGEFVRTEVYAPAHEGLRQQQQVDGQQTVQIRADVRTNSNAIARLESSVTWLARLIIGAVIAYAFQRLVVR
jgi:hypothetical protein